MSATAPNADSVICGPCSLDVHDDCHRHDGEPCACPGDDDAEACGVRLRVFEGSSVVIFCGCCEPDGTHDHDRCEHPHCLNHDAPTATEVAQ